MMNHMLLVTEYKYEAFLFFSCIFTCVQMRYVTRVICSLSCEHAATTTTAFLKKKKKEEIAQTLYCSQYVPFFHLFVEGNMTEGLFCQENCR